MAMGDCGGWNMLGRDSALTQTEKAYIHSLRYRAGIPWRGLRLDPRASLSLWSGAINLMYNINLVAMERMSAV